MRPQATLRSEAVRQWEGSSCVAELEACKELLASCIDQPRGPEGPILQGFLLLGSGSQQLVLSFLVDSWTVQGSILVSKEFPTIVQNCSTEFPNAGVLLS